MVCFNFVSILKFANVTILSGLNKFNETFFSHGAKEDGGIETWVAIITLITCIVTLLKAIISLALGRKSKFKTILPPGPRGIPIIRSVKFLLKSTIEIEAILKTLYAKYGPLVTISVCNRPLIFVSCPSLAHEALIQKGGVFARRPDAVLTAKILTNNQLNISSADYGPTWRLFRRNLISNVIHPSQTKVFLHARKWVLGLLLKRLTDDGSISVDVAEHFKFAMFVLLVFMCFGDKLSESQIYKIMIILQELLTSFRRFQILNLYPWMTRVLFKSRWDELFNLRRRRKEVLLPYIQARREFCKQRRLSLSNSYDENERIANSYADTLLDLEITEKDQTKRKLDEEELVTVCSEFINAGTDTTSTALQWIMANLVKYPIIQDDLFEAIKLVIGTEAGDVEEDKLSKIPYLEAVVLEGLRMHPPTHFSLPHAVSDEANLGGYTIPKNALIFFTLAEMGRDPKIWNDPTEFKPERFMSNKEDLDITGVREIKMMPFGAGRRICPASRLAMLHLEYYVANLIWSFEWTVPKGDVVDLTEKQGFTAVMKHPLRAQLRPRKIK